ncbi:MAG: HPr family phosphocarrier protein [bacterium]
MVERKIVKETVTLTNKLGLHARAAAVLVQTANKFEAEIVLKKKGNSTWVNGKSIMGVLMLAATRGSSLIIKAEGTDAEQMINELSELIAHKFGEEE